MEKVNTHLSIRYPPLAVVILVIMEMANTRRSFLEHGQSCNPCYNGKGKHPTKTVYTWKDSCNPCYNGKGKHLIILIVILRMRCNPCYNGNGKHLSESDCKSVEVVILVIMEKVNTRFAMQYVDYEL